MSKSIICRLAMAALGVALALAGCMSAQNQPGPDAAPGESPYVEAFLEYVGPAARWAGPETLTLHIVAKKDQDLEITIKPALLPGQDAITPSDEDGSVAKRVPAAEKTPSVSSDTVRAALADLVEATKTEPSPVEGCLNLVRVRLLKADGTVHEAQGCRGLGWTRTSSQVSHQFMSYIASGAVGRKPASKP